MKTMVINRWLHLWKLWVFSFLGRPSANSKHHMLTKLLGIFFSRQTNTRKLHSDVYKFHSCKNYSKNAACLCISMNAEKSMDVTISGRNRGGWGVELFSVHIATIQQIHSFQEFHRRKHLVILRLHHVHSISCTFCRSVTHLPHHPRRGTLGCVVTKYTHWIAVIGKLLIHLEKLVLRNKWEKPPQNCHCRCWHNDDVLFTVYLMLTCTETLST